MGDRVFFGFLIEDAHKRLLEEFPDEKIRIFIQKIADYYIHSWKKMAASNKKTSWNWASAFFGFSWMAYRKMLKLALLWFVMLSVLELITVAGASIVGGENFAIGIIALIGISSFLIMPIVFGLFGNYIYASFVYEKLKEIEIIDPDLSESSLLLEGGTSWGKVLLFLAGSLIVEIIYMAIQTSLLSPPSGF
ncbi:MAG: DUF2628 domain-containing protein [Desulfurobacteriaceae bacterium]